MGIDPSLNEAAVSLLSDDCTQPNLGKLLGCWRLTVADGTVPQRAVSLLWQVMQLVRSEAPDVVALELPAEQARGGRGAFFGRAMMSGPLYGIAVGACIAGLEEFRADSASTIRVLYPSVNDWTGRDVPSSRLPSGKEDRHKEQRVRYVEYLYGLKRGALGPKFSAGNAADAIFIARWALWRPAGGEPR